MKEETLDFVKKFKKEIEGVKYTGSNAEIIKDFCINSLVKLSEEINNGKQCLSMYLKAKEPFEHQYWFSMNINDYIMFDGKTYMIIPENCIKEEGWNGYK